MNVTFMHRASELNLSCSSRLLQLGLKGPLDLFQISQGKPSRQIRDLQKQTYFLEMGFGVVVDVRRLAFPGLIGPPGLLGLFGLLGLLRRTGVKRFRQLNPCRACGYLELAQTQLLLLAQ